MADLIPNSQETQQQVESQKASKTRMKLAALAMGAIISGTQAQANDLLAQCDINHDGKISTRKTYKADGVSRAVAKKEFKCKLSYEIAQGEERIAQGEERIAQGEEEVLQGKIVLAQLDMTLENLQKELREVEAELSKNKAELSKNKAELSKNKAELSKNKAELSKNKIELEKKRKWLKKQIEKIIKNSINIS